MFENIKVAAFETLLMSIPESVGLLAFGIGLVGAVVIIRRLLAKTEVGKTEEKFGDQDGKVI